MTQTLLAWTNVLKTAAISATSSDPGLPPENTITDIGGAQAAWQSANGVTNASLIYVLATAGTPVNVIGIFRTNLTDVAQITATITYGGIDTWTKTIAGPAVGYGQVIFVLDSAEYADEITIAIDDPSNPNGFLNVPLAFASDGWTPTYNIDPTFADTWRPIQNVLTTRGGQVYPTMLSNARSATFAMPAVTETQAYTSGREIERLRGLGINVLFIPDTEGAEVKRDAVFGLVSDTRPMGVLQGASRIRTWGATVTERQ